MSESTAVAESSSAPPVVETVSLPRSGTSEYAEWRISGDLPETNIESKPEKEESAPSTEVAEAVASPAQTEQERRKAKSKERFDELLAENKRIKAELESARAPKPVTEPVKQKATQQEPTPEDKNADGSQKFKTYEEYTKALARWEIKQEMAEQAREQQQRTQNQEVQAKVKEAEARYPNFRDIAGPTVEAIVKNQDISPVVKQMLNDSDIFPDLIFTIGSDPKELQAFVEMAKSDPRKALKYIILTENLIAEELDKSGSSTAVSRGENGQFAKPAPTPAKRGPESSPEPPLEVGSRGAGPMDESGRALSAIERGDPNAVRAWMKAENAKDLRRRRGV